MDGFGARLTQPTQDGGAIGDLASDAAADPDWPESPDRLKTELCGIQEVAAV
ncbi:hypothetical protein [Streptomyces sp. NPDC005407]|uniref:hypothetical protein n=1 Tax=Streptomyces sp. NPDC005407 TaxID=3155340 RepID=UPI0033A401EB